MRPRTVVVAYREPLMAEAMASALASFAWLAPVGVASTARETEERAQRVDAVALDRRLQGAKATAARLRRRGIRVVLLGDGSTNGATSNDRERIRQGDGNDQPGREANGDGNRDGNGNGEGDEGVTVSLRDSVASLAWALTTEPPKHRAKSLPLTKRQREILELVAKGLAGKQVARQLGISPKTVERHKTRIFARLGVANQTAAVSLALSDGVGRSLAWNRSNI
jgi:DNA-binding CsgD family transcriptional regulator